MSRNRSILVPLAMVAASAAGLAPTEARAGLVINATFDSTITSDPNAVAIENTINQAIQVYQNAITNPVTVSIKFQEMTSGLGSSNFYYYNISYQSFINALAAHATSANDATALAHLPTGANNPVTNDASIDVKTANLHALGFTGFNSGLAGGFDGIIGLNTTITDIGGAGTTGQYSLLATTEHEIDEILGLGSSLPSPGNYFNDPLPEDLFRYDAVGNRSFSIPTVPAYFSIDGTTKLAQFNNTQSNGGDYGDWQSSPRPNGVAAQVQDAFATPGARPVLGPNEITALDVIGYNFNAVPEPPSIVLAAIGGLGLLAIGWRRRAVVRGLA